jgi:hypothetical protein
VSSSQIAQKWLINQVLAGSNLNTMYAGRIIAGFGIGALTVIGPMGIAE